MKNLRNIHTSTLFTVAIIAFVLLISVNVCQNFGGFIYFYSITGLIGFSASILLMVGPKKGQTNKLADGLVSHYKFNERTGEQGKTFIKTVTHSTAGEKLDQPIDVAFHTLPNMKFLGFYYKDDIKVYAKFGRVYLVDNNNKMYKTGCNISKANEKILMDKNNAGQTETLDMKMPIFYTLNKRTKQ